MWQGKVLRSAIYSIRIVEVVNLSLPECSWKDLSLSFNPFLIWVVANHCACGIYFSAYSAIPFPPCLSFLPHRPNAHRHCPGPGLPQSLNELHDSLLRGLHLGLSRSPWFRSRSWARSRRHSLEQSPKVP